MRIMLVDDDLQAVKRIRNLFLREKLITELELFEEPEVMLRAFEMNPVRLVFIRLGNTGFNGLKLAKDLYFLNPGVKAVFISQSSEYARYAFEAGARDFLIEPINSERLRQTLEKYGSD